MQHKNSLQQRILPLCIQARGFHLNFEPSALVTTTLIDGYDDIHPLICLQIPDGGYAKVQMWTMCIIRDNQPRTFTPPFLKNYFHSDILSWDSCCVPYQKTFLIVKLFLLSISLPTPGQLLKLSQAIFVSEISLDLAAHSSLASCAVPMHLGHGVLTDIQFFTQDISFLSGISQ